MRSGARASLIAALGLGALLASLASGTSCMLITSPGDFTVAAAEGHDASAPTCAPGPNPTACATCLDTKCCSSLSPCQNSPACSALLGCAQGDTSCEKDNASGQTELKALTSCADKECPICSESGIGDPCTSGATCGPTLTCAASSWCTKSCAGDADCAGVYMAGENSSGGQNRCVIDAENAAVCFPGCAVTSDCFAFPGTVCEPASASNGGNTNVCSAPPPDAGSSSG